MSQEHTFATIETAMLNRVSGGKRQQQPCPDAATQWGDTIGKGVNDGARRIDAAVEAGRRGDLLGVLGNAGAALVDAAGTAKDVLGGPSTPMC